MDIHVARRYGAVLALLTGLFFLRIAGQFIQALAPQAFLPDFGAFQGSALSYGALLLSQIVILTAMAISTSKVFRCRSRPSANTARWLLWLGAIYMVVSLGRIAIGLVGEDPHLWFRAWIPAFFHVVLASFVLTLGRFHFVGSSR